MKRPGIFALAVSTTVLALSSCVSAPAPSGPAAGSAPVARERIEEIKVPVLSKETRSFADGLVDRVTAYEYDPTLSRLLTVTTSRPSASGPMERTVFEYDPDGRRSSKSVYGADAALVTKAVYSYDPAGNTSREVIQDGKGQIQSQSEWTWEGARKLSWRVLDAAGVTLARTEYAYAAIDLPSEAVMYGSGGIRTGLAQFEYDTDPAGRPRIRKTVYRTASGAPDGSVVTELDDKGRASKEIHYRPDGRTERSIWFEYGPDGAVLKSTFKDASGTVREIAVYEYSWRTETRTVVYYE